MPLFFGALILLTPAATFLKHALRRAPAFCCLSYAAGVRLPGLRTHQICQSGAAGAFGGAAGRDGARAVPRSTHWPGGTPWYRLKSRERCDSCLYPVLEAISL